MACLTDALKGGWAENWKPFTFNYLHGVGGAVGEAPYGVVAAVGVLDGRGEGDPARKVTVSGDGEGALERADA